MMKVSLILTAVDRITKPIREALRSIEALGAATTAVGAKVAEAMGAATRTTTELEHATSGAARAERDLAVETGKVAVATEKVGGRGLRVIEEYGAGVGRAERATEGLAARAEAASAATGRIGMHVDAILGVGRAAATIAAPIETATGAATALGTELGAVGAKATVSADKVGASAGRMRRALASVAAIGRGAGARLGGGAIDAFDFTRDAGAHFRGLVGEKGIASAGRSVAYLKSQVSGLTGGLTLLKYASIGAGIGLGEEFVRGVFKVGGETDQMLVTLTRLEGGADKARRAMSWMQSFAIGAGAQYSMPDIMRSYQMAKNFGMNPQGGSLAAFADLAAGERVPLKQVLYAVKDAMEGTSTRPLANLGIKMKQGKKPGDPNSYLYSDLSGQWVTKTSVKSPEATLTALLGIIQSKYAGLALQQAKTLPGGVAQLHKALYMFEGMIAGGGVMGGKTGVYGWALKQINDLIGTVRRAAADGSLAKLAKKISDFMTGTGDKIIAFLRGTDWAAVGKDLGALGVAFGVIGSGLKLLAMLGGGGLSGLFNALIVSRIIGVTSALAGFSGVIAAATTMLTGFDIAAAPIALTIGLIGALAAVAYLVWANWDKLQGPLRKLWNGMPAWAKAGVSGLLFVLDPLVQLPHTIIRAWNLVGPALKDAVAKLPAPPGWVTTLLGGVINPLGAGAKVGNAIWNGIAGPVAAPKPGKPRLDAAWRGAAARLSAGPGALPHGQSTLTIDFKNPPSGMRVRSIDAHAGQTINVKRGPVSVGG